MKNQNTYIKNRDHEARSAEEALFVSIIEEGHDAKTAKEARFMNIVK